MIDVFDRIGALLIFLVSKLHVAMVFAMSSALYLAMAWSSPETVTRPASDLLERLLAVDKVLSANGYPAMSPFWRRTLRDFLRGNWTWLIGRIGRRGGKGLVSCKLAVTFALFFPLDLPPGEHAFVQFLSVDRDEASNRLRMIDAMLRILGEPFVSREGEIELVNRPVTFRVTTASLRAVVGRTSILVIGDEAARWRDDTSTNPAKEILASVAPSLLTTAGRGLFLSAPWSTTDEHAIRFETGTNDHQMVCYAPTWIANSSVSEAQTRALEPDPRLWAREYLGNPVEAIYSILSADEYHRLEQEVERRLRMPGAIYGMVVDPALKNDAWTATVFHREVREGSNGGTYDVIVQDAILHHLPRFLSPLKLDDEIEATVRLALEYGVKTIYSDGHYSGALEPRFQERGLRLEVLSMTPAAITARVESLQARIANGGISFLRHEAQQKEFLQGQVIHGSGGRLTFKAPERRGCHDDTISCWLGSMDIGPRLPFSEGDLVIRHDAIRWDPETRTIVGGFARYYTPFRNGVLVEREPPIATEDFEHYARTHLEHGRTTVTVERWLAARGIYIGPTVDPREALAMLDAQEAESDDGVSVRITY